MSPGQSVSLSRIGVLILGVRDMQKSLAFYRDTLGLPLRGAGGEFAFLDAGSITLALREARDLAPAQGDWPVEVVFSVDDIEAAYASLRSRGVTFRVEPRIVTGDQLAADFRDPDGHILSIFGPRAAT